MKAKQIVLDILEEKEFKLGTPWRYSDSCLGTIIPIMREKALRRNYKIQEEVKDKIKINDTGNINKATMTNTTNSYVFIRLGTILMGATQERAIQHSIILKPLSEEVGIPIRCIHASKGIRRGAGLCMMTITSAPARLKANLCLGENQGKIWDTVKRDNRARMTLCKLSASNRATITSKYGLDDFVGITKELHASKNEITKLVKKVPLFENQVGIVVLDNIGIKSIECFDSPESWEAFYRAIVREHAETLLTEQRSNKPLFKFDATAIPEKIKEFLNLYKGIKEEEVWKEGQGKVVIYKNEKVGGEYAFLGDKCIYTFANRREELVKEMNAVDKESRRIAENYIEQRSGPWSGCYGMAPYTI